MKYHFKIMHLAECPNDIEVHLHAPDGVHKQILSKNDIAKSNISIPEFTRLWIERFVQFEKVDGEGLKEVMDSFVPTLIKEVEKLVS